MADHKEQKAATPSLGEVEQIIKEQVVERVLQTIKEQEDKLKALVPGADPHLLAASEGFIRSAVDNAFSGPVLADIKARLVKLLMTGKSEVRRNRAAVA